MSVCCCFVLASRTNTRSPNSMLCRHHLRPASRSQRVLPSSPRQCREVTTPGRARIQARRGHRSPMAGVLSVLDQLDVSFVDVSVALQCHATQHVLRACSLRCLSVGARPTVTFLSSSSSSNSLSSSLPTRNYAGLVFCCCMVFHGPLGACTPACLSGLTSYEPAACFPTKMKKYLLVHASRCLGAVPLVPSPICPHVFQ